MPLLDDQVVNRDRSKFYFTLLTKIDPEPEGFTTRRHTGLGRRERLIRGSYIPPTSTVARHFKSQTVVNQTQVLLHLALRFLNYLTVSIAVFIVIVVCVHIRRCEFPTFVICSGPGQTVRQTEASWQDDRWQLA